MSQIEGTPVGSASLFVWIRNIPGDAHKNQVMGALKSQGYTAKNTIKLEKGTNNTQYTLIELENEQLVENLINVGLTFGKPPNTVKLTIQRKQSKESNTKQQDICRFYNSTGCTRNNCPFKHIKKQNTASKNKMGGRSKSYVKEENKQTICRFYNTPAGCTKPNCTFKHVKTSTSVRSKSYVKNEDEQKQPEPGAKGRRTGKGYNDRGRGGGYNSRRTRGGYTTRGGYNARGRGQYNNKGGRGIGNKYGKPKRVGFYITAIIDMSGSMAGSRIKAATMGLELLFGNLGDEDYVSLIGFNQKAETIVPPGKYGDLKDVLPNKLKECNDKCRGGTAMWDAIDAAVKTQKNFFNNKTVQKQRIIVVTDGEDNRSSISSDNVIANVAYLLNQYQPKNTDFTLTVIAVGEACKSKDLQKLCRPNYCHLKLFDDFHGISSAIGNAWK